MLLKYFSNRLEKTTKAEKKSTRRQIRCAVRIKHSMGVRVADKIVCKSADCAQKKSARVRVAHKTVDYGVAPERRFGQEVYTKKCS